MSKQTPDLPKRDKIFLPEVVTDENGNSAAQWKILIGIRKKRSWDSMKTKFSNVFCWSWKQWSLLGSKNDVVAKRVFIFIGNMDWN